MTKPRTLLVGAALWALNVQAQTSNIVGYEYWFDQSNTHTFVPLPAAQTVTLTNEALNTSGLSLGQHVAHFRLKDQQGGTARWSSVITRTLSVGQPAPWEIIAVRYWWSDLANPPLGTDMRYKYFDDPEMVLNYNDILDLCGYPTGPQVLKFQLLDNHGQWSSVLVRPVSIASAGAPDVVQSITPSGLLCPGTNVTFTANHTVVAPNGTPTSFTWTVPAGYTIVSGQGTQTLEVTIGNTAGSLSVTASNYCGDAPASFAVTPILPEVLTNVSGPAIACEGSGGGAYSTQSFSGTYAWSAPAGWSFTPPNPSGSTSTASANAGAQSGAVSVYVTNACGVNSNTVSVPVTVDGDALITSINGNTSSGQGGSVVITAVAPNATAFNWSLPAGWAWDESGIDTLDAVANLTAPTDTGSYTICVTTESSTGCTDTACWSVQVDLNVGINGSELSGMSVYPNPNNGRFVVDLGRNGNGTLTLRDPLGRLVKSIRVVSQTTTIEVNELACGTYLLECLLDDQRSEQFRIVVNH